MNTDDRQPNDRLETMRLVLQQHRLEIVDATAKESELRETGECPVEGCGHKGALEAHVRACAGARRLACPFAAIIGCHGDENEQDDEEDCGGEMRAHLARHSASHVTALLHWVENRFNEIEYRKIESEKSICDKIDHANVIRKGDVDSVKESLDSLTNMVDRLKQDLIRLKKESEEKQSIIVHLQRRDREKTQQIDELKRQLVEVVSMKDNRERNNEKEKLTSLKFESKSLSEFKQQIETKLDSLTVQVDSMESILSVVNHGEFVWKIDNFSTKCQKSELGIDTEIHSPGFYSHRNGYRLCLCAYPSGGGVGEGTHLSLGFTILRGEFDDLLPWPMKHEVMFCLIDQHSGAVYRTAAGNYLSTPIDNRCVFHRPQSDKNMCLSRPRFISLSELFNNRNLLRNDTIIVKCVVNL